MTDIDDRIGAALDADDREFLQRLDEERGLFAQIGDTMTGPLGGWAKLVFAVAALLAALLFYSVWQLISTTDLRQMILWTAATLGILIALGFTKEWFFSRMNLLTVLREIKRLELRLAELEERR